MKTPDGKKVFFELRLRITLLKIQSNGCRKLQQLGCTVYASGSSCFHNDLTVLKAFALKVFTCPNKKVLLFLSDKYIY